jgi:uncharacterized OsmC-like protein
MVDRNTLKEAFFRTQNAMQNRPSLAQGTYRTVVRPGPGMKVICQEGDWQATSDLADTLGGEGKEPTPGFFLRAALGTCIGSTLTVEAAALDLNLRDFTVEILADYDSRGEMGVDLDLAAYLNIRCHIAVDCDSDDDTLDSLVAGAMARSSIVVMLAKGTDLSWTVSRTS